jgi:hypothetical protein
MQGAILYGPRDVRFEERYAPDDHQANRCRHQDLGHLRMRVRPVALPWHQPGRPADSFLALPSCAGSWSCHTRTVRSRP